MGQSLMVATRKGLFALDAEGAIQMRSFLGEPVTAVARDAADGTLYAALNLGHFGCKMHRSEDDGATWTEVAAPSCAGVAGDPPPSLELIWTLEVQDEVLWAGTIPGGLFTSDDRGASWSLNRPLWDHPLRGEWMGGGYDHPGVHSISFDPRTPGRLAVGVSCGGSWLSEDGGASWQIHTDGMFADYVPPEFQDNPAQQDPHRLARCAADPDVIWTQHHNGVFKSEDGGRTWRLIMIDPSNFGFAVAAHPKDPKTAWFAPAVKDQQRYPVDGRFVVTRTRDGGASFETLSRGLPQAESYDLVYRHGMDVDDTGERLAVGSTTGNLWLSVNGGDDWRFASAHLPPIYAVLWV